mgnify:FL=1
MISRKVLREKIVQAIYACMMQSGINEDFDPIEVFSDVFECDYTDIDIYAKEIFLSVLDKQAEIIEACQTYLEGWTFDRLNSVTKAILLEAVAEGNYVKETNKKIIVNEAINMAKKYIPNEDYKKVNAILDKVIHE